MLRSNCGEDSSSGEILAWGISDIASAIDLWASEKDDYIHFLNGESYGQYGHYEDSSTLISVLRLRRKQRSLLRNSICRRSIRLRFRRQFANEFGWHLHFRSEYVRRAYGSRCYVECSRYNDRRNKQGRICKTEICKWTL